MLLNDFIYIFVCLGGLEGEKDYPYEAKDDQCEFKKNKIKVYINGSVTISKNETG